MNYTSVNLDLVKRVAARTFLKPTDKRDVPLFLVILSSNFSKIAELLIRLKRMTCLFFVGQGQYRAFCLLKARL